MENVFLTSLTLPEVKQLFKDELKTFFDSWENHSQPLDTDEFLTIEQAATFLKLEKQTLYTLVSKSKIPHMKQGKRLHFLKSELTTWLKAGRRKTIKEIEAAA